VLRASAIVAFGLCLLAAAGAGALKMGWLGDPWASFEKNTLNPGFRSSASPGEFGLVYRRIVIHSGFRRLEGFFVPSAPDCAGRNAVLVFHGRNETIADWVKVQQRFHQACIASMVFDYSGHGHSDGPGTIANLNADAIAAFEQFVRLTPGFRHCLLSHSMGGGPMLWAAMSILSGPDCIVIASPFSSLRSMAVRGGMPVWFSYVMPDVWDNASAVTRIHAPLLWIHSRADRTIPIAEGKAVFDAAPSPKTALTLDSYNHNAIYKQLPDKIWTPMIAFIRADQGSATQLSKP
jgi:alpha-beta hydrolase superfamily lysophospholipase